MSLNQMISQARKQAPDPVERLERQACSWAKLFVSKHRARWDIPVVQRAVDDTQGKEGWRGLLSGCRNQPLGETGNRVWAGRSPGGGRATPSGERQSDGDVKDSMRPSGASDVRRAECTPLYHLPASLDSRKGWTKLLECGQRVRIRVEQSCHKVGIRDPKLSKTPVNLSEIRKNRVKKANLHVKNTPEICQKPLFDVKNYGYSC